MNEEEESIEFGFKTTVPLHLLVPVKFVHDEHATTKNKTAEHCWFEQDETIASRETRATIEASKAMAAKYDADVTEDEEDADDAAFAEFLAEEFDMD